MKIGMVGSDFLFQQQQELEEKKIEIMGDASVSNPRDKVIQGTLFPSLMGIIIVDQM